MFKRLFLFAIVGLTVQMASFGTPAMADHYTREANRKSSEARRELKQYRHQAYQARCDRRCGRGLRAKLHSHHAAHLYKRSMEHASEARADRYVARHRF